MRIRQKYRRGLLLILGALSVAVLYEIGIFTGNLQQRGRSGKMQDGVVSLRDSEKMHGLMDKDTRPDLSLPRIAKFCNSPSSQDLGHEGLVSTDYRLVNAHVLILHGDSSPTTRLLHGLSANLTCHMNTNQYTLHPKVHSFVSVMATEVGKIPKDLRFNRWALFPTHPKCKEGQLTGLGAVQHILNGVHYNKRYYSLHSLFDQSNWHNKVVVHTISTSSAFQSAIAFLHGFLPNFDLEKINLIGSDSLTFCENDKLGFNCDSLGLESLRTKADRECRLDHFSVTLMEMYRHVADDINSILKVQIKELHHPATLLNGLNSYVCHNLPWPCNTLGACITAKTLEPLWNLVDYHRHCLSINTHYRKYADLTMQVLLYRIAEEMKTAITNKSNPTFHLYSSLDTTFSPMIAALELKDTSLPGYASRLVFELYQRINKKDYFLRVLQNGNIVTPEVMFCRKNTENGFCNFEYFYNHVTSYINNCTVMSQ